MTYRWAMRIVLAVLALLVFALVLVTAAGAQGLPQGLPQAPSPRQLAVPVTAVWGTSIYAVGAGAEWHHAYLGFALLACPSRRVQWVGLAVLADDALQHAIQTRRPAYRSPLHRAYAVTLYRWTH